MNSNFQAYGKGIEFDHMPAPFFLVGLLNAFNNRFQGAGDRFFQEISWKQCFLLNCIPIFRTAPTIRELGELVGCSHQNTKQLLEKLERAGFVALAQDGADRRKRRIYLTEKAQDFRRRYNEQSGAFMERLFSCLEEEELQDTIKTIAKLDARLKEMTEEGL